MTTASDDRNFDFIDISLGIENAIDPNMFIAPLDRKLGSEPDIEEHNIRLKIGRRPIVRNLKSLIEDGGKKVPENLQVFVAYDLWLVTFSFSVIKDRGFHKLSGAGQGDDHQVQKVRDRLLPAEDGLPELPG